jgi:hypothetical protein
VSFKDIIENKNNYKVNFVAEFIVEGTSYYFSKYQVDTGLVIPDDNVGLLNEVSVQPAQVDLRSVRTSVPATTLKIIDIDLIFTKFIGSDTSALQGREVRIYIGLKTGSFDFSDYIQQSRYFVRRVRQQGDKWSISCRGTTDEIQKRTFTIQGNLLTAMSDVTTSAVVTTGQDIFQTTGTIKIGDEFMQYSSKSFNAGVTTFTSLSRGDLNSEIVSHEAGDAVFQVERIEDENPITILLQILLSTGQGTNGSYDVLTDGIGIPEANILVSKFETIRSDFFAADEFSLYLYDIENTLKYLEKEIFQANNVRLTEEDGLLSLAVLDQSLPGSELPIVDADVITEDVPEYEVSQDQIVNYFDMRYFYVEGTKQYTRFKNFKDDASIAQYGLKKGSTLEFKGIQSDAIAQDRGARFLNRFKTPQAKIEVTQFLSTYSTPVGDKVNFTHPDIANAGVRGLNAELELLKKAIDYAQGVVKASYVFTSYFNIRRGLIAPCKTVTEVLASNTLRIGVDEGKYYKIGFSIRLWDLTNDEFFNEPTNYITNIIKDAGGDILVFENDWINAAASTTAIRFGLYATASDDQKSRYAFIVPDSGIFADGTGGYKIF